MNGRGHPSVSRLCSTKTANARRTPAVRATNSLVQLADTLLEFFLKVLVDFRRSSSFDSLWCDTGYVMDRRVGNTKKMGALFGKC